MLRRGGRRVCRLLRLIPGSGPLMHPSSHDAQFPLWLELSGLPGRVNEVAKVPYAWPVFRKIVEMDMAANPLRPGLVEVTPDELAERCGLDAKKLGRAVKGLRKAAVLRAFLPDHEEEPALFQVLTPVPTPRPPDEVRSLHPDLFLEAPWPPRYAVETPEEAESGGEERRGEEKIKRVVELYLNTFSMRLNSLILDQLQLMANHYDLRLIERVFERARKREARSLGWVMTEIRREIRNKEKIKN